MEYIITHGGMAHRDDFLAVSLALALNGTVPVLRRNPMDDELNNPDVLVLDVGGQYDPALNNFDHHQLDGQDEIALTLYAKANGIDLSVYDWAALSVVQDNRGPGAAAAFLGIPSEAYRQCASPIEQAILRKFADDPSSLNILMWAVGTGILQYIEDIERQSTWLLDQELEDVNGVAVLDATTFDGIISVKALKCVGLYPDIIVSTVDDRGPGVTLYRTPLCEDIDLHLLNGVPTVMFAHKSGFLVKARPGTDWRQLIRMVA